MAKRSNLIVTLGLIVFLVGAAATYLIVRDKGDAVAAGGNRVSVLYAAKDITAGTAGDTALSQGAIKTRAVDVSARPANALTDSSQLAGKTALAPIPEGQVLTSEQFTQTQTRIGTVKIPPGKTALAVQLAHVPGVAGFAGAGDKVDIFGVVRQGVPTPGPAAHMIMQNVEVLNVNGTTLATAQGQPGGTGLVFLLSVTPAQAERLVYLTTFEQLYFSLVPKDQAPVPPTPGSGVADALKLA